MIDGLLQKSSKKNLVKIFESLENTDSIRARSKSLSKGYEVIFKKKVHRHKITSIIVTDSMYTASLDHTVRKHREE